MRKLVDIKPQADDVLHSQVSNKAGQLSLDDSPPGALDQPALAGCAS
jgi:hypothetical protein